MPEKRKQVIQILSKSRTNDGKKRVVAYCRVSTQADMQMHSLNAQVEYYHSLFGQHDDWEFCGIFADEGISGTRSSNRVQFLQMIEKCRAGEIDAIVTKSVSRFGRNTIDTLTFTRELRLLGVDVFFEKENLHSCSSEGELLLTLMAAFAEPEIVSMSDNIKWGKKRRYENGAIEALALSSLLGFVKKNGVWAINEEEARVVRRIYDDFLTGATYDEIAKALADEAVPTKRPGSVWKSKTVANIIGNEKYCGDCLFQKTYIEDPLTHKHRINQGQLPQFFVEDCLPAIIEKEKWRAVQEMRKRHKAHTRCAVERAPFRNMIFCGVCGKQVVPHYTHTLNRQMLLRYRCSSYKGMNGMAVEGMMYTPLPKANYVQDVSPEMQAYREKYGRPLPPRQMLCTDIRLPEDKPRKAFVQVWNILVSRLQRLTTTLSHTAETDENALTRFKAKEMIDLLEQVGKINEFDFFLMRRTVDRFVTTVDGKLTVIFLSGIKMTI